MLRVEGAVGPKVFCYLDASGFVIPALRRFGVLQRWSRLFLIRHHSIGVDS